MPRPEGYPPSLLPDGSRNRAYHDRWRADNAAHLKAHKRAYYLAKTHGLTVREYAGMVEAQDGLCAACGKPSKAGTPHTEPLVVDHDHGTGRIRGLLCTHCNTMLGWYERNRKAIEAHLDA